LDEARYTVLAEENGEVARALCDYRNGVLTTEEERDRQLYTELVQVAAVAAAWCEAILQRRRRAPKAQASSPIIVP
jgi:hypothetical protein